MICRRAEWDKDFNALVTLFEAEIKETYGDLASDDKRDYMREVLHWRHGNYDVIIVEKEAQIIGFSCGVVSGGILKEHFYGAHAFVLPSSRKTKAAILLYGALLLAAEKANLPIIANGLLDGNVNKILGRFGTPLFITFIRTKNE